jgi:hypothetical protein
LAHRWISIRTISEPSLANLGWGERPGSDRPSLCPKRQRRHRAFGGAEQFGRFLIAAIFDEWVRREGGPQRSMPVREWKVKFKRFHGRNCRAQADGWVRGIQRPDRPRDQPQVLAPRIALRDAWNQPSRRSRASGMRMTQARRKSVRAGDSARRLNFSRFFLSPAALYIRLPC